MTTSIHLCDLVGTAEIDAPAKGMVDLQYMEVDGDFSMAIFQHPDSRVRIAVDGATGGVLRTAVGIKSSVWERVQGPITFRVGADVNGRTQWRHERTLDPRRKDGDRRWVPLDVALPAGTAAVVLETKGKRKRTAYAWSGWADPVVELSGTPTTARRARHARRSHPGLLLITSDACRADLLGCYGAADARTPNLDALAAEGLVCEGARTNSTTTVGSYATAWTGRWPFVHGVNAEWGTFPTDRPNLVTVAKDAGYGSVFAASELETGSPEQGFGAPFDEVIPCVANPSQDGTVTTRQFLRWLDDRPDAPYLAWVAYYDTHPPLRLPKQVVSEFYDGDPRDPARTFEPEGVAAMHAVEALLEIEVELPALRAGHAAGPLYFRLRDTARALNGEIASGPDLASHLAALGPSARNGLSVPEFVAWLDARCELLANGVVEPELVDWLEALMPELRAIESEILTGLRGVVDFRYVHAQAKAAVAHLDVQIGALVARLREEGTYGDTTILFMSGHGELFGEGGQYGHHQAPREPVLQVPLVIKPARGSALSPRRVQGPIESVDLLPTLSELLGFAPVETDGASRLQGLRSGVIPDRDTFAIDAHGLTAVMRRGAHKLVLARAWLTIDGEIRAPGSARLFQVEGNRETPIDDAEVLAAMSPRLEEWTARLPVAPP